MIARWRASQHRGNGWRPARSTATRGSPSARTRCTARRLQGIYGVVTTTQAIGVLPFVDPDHVLLVRQWRYVAGRALGDAHRRRAPGGPFAAAQRELAEEIRYRAGRLVAVSEFPRPRACRRDRDPSSATTSPVVAARPTTPSS